MSSGTDGGERLEGEDERLDDRLDLDEDVDVDVPADVRPPGEHAGELPGEEGNRGGDVPEGEQRENAESSEDQPSQ